MTGDLIAARLADAGVHGWVHAVPVLSAGDEEVGVAADDPAPMASLYKLPLAVTWARAVAAGDLDPRQRLVMSPAQRTSGPTGVSTLLDEVTLTARDAVRLMLTVSDNAAADHLLRIVGLDRVNACMAELGLASTQVLGGSQQSQATVRNDTRTDDFAAAMRALADLDRVVVTSEYDAALASSTTARDMTTLLVSLWTGKRGYGEAGDLVRTAMTQQAWRHRLGSGFPHDDVVVAGKTGTLGTLRHEVGVVTFPDEVPVAVAVLTRAVRAERQLPRVDSAIGAVAREAVTPLRRPR